MQITIGEYTTRNGCRAIVDARDSCLFSGVVIAGGGLTQLRVWWNENGYVRFPGGNWEFGGHVDFSGISWVFVSDNSMIRIWYSESTYNKLMATPSPFDITEPKQKPTMKSPLKPGKYKTLIGHDAYVLQLPYGVSLKDKYGDAGLAVLFMDGSGHWNIERRMLDGRYNLGAVLNHDIVESVEYVEADSSREQATKEPPKSVLVQKQRLIKLPNGTWLDPREIVSISAHLKHGTIFQDRVVISYSSELQSTINCASLAEAQKLADDLAEKVNSIK